MKRSRIIIGVLVMGLVASATFTATANEPKYSDREWEQVFEEFDLEIASDVPAGVSPLVVTSPGQLRKLLSGMKNGKTEFTIDVSILQEASMLTAGETRELTETYVILHETESSEWPVVFHLYAKVWIVGSGSFWQITECDDRAYFTGWLPWTGTDDEWSSSHIYSNNVEVEVEGGGLFYGYILIPGFGEFQIYWRTYHGVIDYSLY
jgi:hypothetical protein